MCPPTCVSTVIARRSKGLGDALCRIRSHPGCSAAVKTSCWWLTMSFADSASTCGVSQPLDAHWSICMCGSMPVRHALAIHACAGRPHPHPSTAAGPRRWPVGDCRLYYAVQVQRQYGRRKGEEARSSTAAELRVGEEAEEHPPDAGRPVLLHGHSEKPCYHQTMHVRRLVQPQTVHAQHARWRGNLKRSPRPADTSCHIKVFFNLLVVHVVAVKFGRIADYVENG